MNCERQVSPQIFHSNFQALAGPLRVIQRLVLKPLVLALCFGLLPCGKVNFWPCASLILCYGACFSSRSLLHLDQFAVSLIVASFPISDTERHYHGMLRCISQAMSVVWHSGQGADAFSNNTGESFYTFCSLGRTVGRHSR